MDENIQSLIFDKLEDLAEKKGEQSSQLAYYFADRDSNRLKNVTIGKIVVDEFTTYHTHDFFEANYCMKGSLYQHIGDKSFVLHEGDLLFMSPGVYHACFCSKDTLCYNILFRKDYLLNLAREFEKYDTNNYLSSIAANKIYMTFSFGKQNYTINEILQKSLDASRTLNHHVDLYENLSFENITTEFLLMLTKYPRHEYNFIAQAGKRNTDYTPDDMVKYIYDNYDKINLPDTAARFGYSKSQFHRIIKENTGFTFTDIVLSMRMQQARHYLLNTNLSIKNIASILGIDSAEHFSRMFKKNRGYSPKAYRETFKRKQ